MLFLVCPSTPLVGSLDCELNQWANVSSLSSVWQKWKSLRLSGFDKDRSEQLGGSVHFWVVTIETAFLSAHLAMSIKIEDVKKKKKETKIWH